MKRYAMEFIGTFFLTVAISLIGNPISIGLMLMAMIYVGAHVSGGHFNPAVSFASFIQQKLSLIDMGLYILAQSLGSLAALCFFVFITNNSYELEMVPGNYIAGPLAIEALFVVVFCWICLTMSSYSHFRNSVISGVVIGLTLMGIVFMGGGLFNPAVAIASTTYSVLKDGAVAGESAGGFIVYVVGPLLGSIGASFLFSYFKPEAELY